MILSNYSTGDGLENRLLLSLSTITGEKFRYIKTIKDGIWLCYTDSSKWILKEFFSEEKLFNQIHFVEQLFKHDFYFTYQFHPIHQEKIIKFDQRVFALVEYLKKGSTFTYQTFSERTSALKLLKQFHETTSQFRDIFKPNLTVFDQQMKWEQRLKEFIANIPLLINFIPTYYLNKYVDWAKWALSQMERNKSFYNEGPNCIIHGDVAHHNFLLNRYQQLYIIDFDLIQLANPMIDYLQFANRVLPNISWSLTRLRRHQLLTPYLEMKEFLIALIFPTDILREWNRYVRLTKKEEGSKPQLLTYLKEITLNHFNMRRIFTEELAKSI